MTRFAALPGFYNLLFLYLEPLSTATPAIFVMLYPGAGWFFNELIPASTPPSSVLDPRANVAVWQLANCYFLLGLISSVVFRAIRDALPNNPMAQERILGASLLCLAIADITHIIATFVTLPGDIRFDFANWNTMTHGNITTVVVLFAVRMAWFMGIGRTRYYFGQTESLRSKKA